MRPRPLRERIRFIGVLGSAVMGLLGFRLGQITEAESYAETALQHALVHHAVAPPRGRILDRHGHVLADTQPAVDLVVGPEGPELRSGYQRTYPGGVRATHLLGVLTTASRSDLAADGSTRPGAQVGRGGIEQAFEQALRGSPGRDWSIIDAEGHTGDTSAGWAEPLRTQARLQRHKPSAGADLLTTVDVDLQRAAEQALSGRTGAVVAMDVHTGALLAYASGPDWDPREVSGGATADDWADITQRGALTDRAARGLVEPAGVFGLITAASALDNGIPPEHTVDCRRKRRRYKPSNARKYHCWNDRGHGQLDLEDALVQGCDAWLRAAGRDLGPDLLRETALQLGLGTPTGFELTPDAKGLLPNASALERLHGRSWTVEDSALAALGRGTTLATPLQLAVMTSAIANGGRIVTPWVVDRVVSSEGKIHLIGGPPAELSGLRPELAKELRNVMQRAVESEHSALRLSGVSWAGYGGESRDLPGLESTSDTGVFVAFTPAETPRYAVVATVMDGDLAAAQAAAAKVVVATAPTVPLASPEGP